MIKTLIPAAIVAALACPAAAENPDTERAEVIASADAFFDALRSEDKSLLAGIMRADGTIMIEDRTNPENTNRIVLPSALYLQSHLAADDPIDEIMRYDSILIDGGMAQVWGPYRFTAGGQTTHCGINSLTFMRSDGGWQLGNTSFTMVAPDQCEAIGAPEKPE